MAITCPGSIVEIDVEKVGKKMRFKRIFVALKSCVDGFIAGCRPFIGVDASNLNGKYTGQLASTTGVDGHNWVYHIAYGIFDCENEDNWKWFMHHLRRAVGSPKGLVICTDACKGLEKAVGAVFPEVEYRECMRHLYTNFMKHYTGEVFLKHLYPAASSFTEGLFKWHLKKIYDFAPDAIKYLHDHHNRIWYRAGFSEDSKYDYLTNNVSESFNSQVRDMKGLLIHELVDGLREMIMEKRYLRRNIGREMEEGILPSVIKELNLIGKHLTVVKVVVSDADFAEVTLLDDWGNTKRHTVDLVNHCCGYRQWQVTGKPCRHALAWILSNRGLEIKDYVHDYYSVSRFRAAYADRFPPMPDKADWPEVELGYKLHPPLQKRAAGMPRVVRIRGSMEERANKRKVKCRTCKGYGHFEKTCKLAEPTEDDDGIDEAATIASLKRVRQGDEGSSNTTKKRQKIGATKQAPKEKQMAIAMEEVPAKKKKTPVKKKL